MPARLLDPISVSAFDERGQCDGCRWPDVCGRDGTCWNLERELAGLWPDRPSAPDERAPIAGPPIRLHRGVRRPISQGDTL